MLSFKVSSTARHPAATCGPRHLLTTPVGPTGPLPTARRTVTCKWAVDAADAIKLAMQLPRKMLIGGDWMDAESGKSLPVYDPRTEEVIMHVPAAESADVDKAVAAARKAFDEGPWPRMTARERGRIMYKLADLIEKHSDELAMLEALDVGKPVTMAKTVDIAKVITHLRYFAGWADKIHGKTVPVDAQAWAYTLREPLGVVGQIVPWNFPLLMTCFKVAPALACGNTVVLKAAEQTPMTAMRLGQLALEAGLPAGVLNILTGYGPEAGAPLVSHQGVDKIAFTGSCETGRKIAETAGRLLKPCTLELGGKSPFIVDRNVDVDFAVAQAHDAAFLNGGQCCTAASRTFVHASIYEEFVQKATEAANNRRVGDPFDDVDQGPQVDKEQFDKAMRYIQQGKQEGARLVAGGSRIGSQGYFIQPTVFAGVLDGMSISREEIFGPVQCITVFDSYDEVIARANDSPYGLAAAVFSNNIDVVNKLTRSLQAGTVWVNCYNIVDQALPFGGYKESGLGRENGEEALNYYTKVKSVYQALDHPAWL